MTDKSADHRNAMSLSEILQWTWSETAPLHKNRVNLLIHLVAVPMFVAGHVLLLAGLLLGLHLLIIGLCLIVASLVLQKFGHSLEEHQAVPFAGPYDFVRRIYIEQFSNFWRFLLSGQWYVSIKGAGGRT